MQSALYPQHSFLACCGMKPDADTRTVNDPAKLPNRTADANRTRLLFRHIAGAQRLPRNQFHPPADYLFGGAILALFPVGTSSGDCHLRFRRRLSALIFAHAPAGQACLIRATTTSFARIVPSALQAERAQSLGM